MCPKLFDHTSVKYIMHEGITELDGDYMMEQGFIDPVDKIMTPVWMPHIIQTYKEIQPDLVVSDFLLNSGAHAADELGIPCVINIPIAL